MEVHNIELLDQNKAGQALLLDRDAELDDAKRELQKKEKQAERLHEEARRLESLLDSKGRQHEAVMQDFDRVRSQKIDDALLIERLRNQQGEQKDFVNTIVGKISNFARQLEEIGQANLSVHVEGAYTVARKIVPATGELLPVFHELDAFVRHLSHEIVTQLANLPERDSDSRSSRGNAGIAAEATNLLSGAHNSLPRHPADYHGISNAPLYSSHQQSVSGLNSHFQSNDHQEPIDGKNFTLNSQGNNHFRSMQQVNVPNVTFSEQDKLKTGAQSQRPPLMVEQIQEARANAALQQAEIDTLKNRVGYYQDAQALDSEEKADLEQALKLVFQIVALPNSIRLLIQQLSVRVKDVYQTRRDKAALSQKLIHLE